MDVQVENHGTLFLVRPISEAAHVWMATHLPSDAQRLGTAVAVEPRYVADIVAGMQADGLDVQ